MAVLTDTDSRQDGSISYTISLASLPGREEDRSMHGERQSDRQLGDREELTQRMTERQRGGSCTEKEGQSDRQLAEKGAYTENDRQRGGSCTEKRQTQ